MMSEALRLTIGRRPHARHLASVTALTLLGTLGACATQQELITAREDKLSAAGFIVKPARTPGRQAMLARLPANRFVMRTSGDSVNYVYADPIVCGCLYVGTQDAYSRYKAQEQTQRIADEQLLAAQTYSDASWSWGAWGPIYPSFGYYGAIGW